jgi:glycosyltransferase involved in cell wall biosynthesis
MCKTIKDTEALIRYYGLEPNANLHIVQLPILRREKWPRISWHEVFNFFCKRLIRRLTKEIGPDLIYLSEIKLANCLLRSNSPNDIPYVYEVHGLYAPDYMQPLAIENEVFHKCKALITTTQSLQEVMARLYGNLPSCYRVPLATEIPAHVRSFVPPAAGEPWCIGYFGQLYPLQGVDVLLRAIALLPANVRLEVIGGRNDHISDLRCLAEQTGVSRRVTFHGFVPPPEVPEKASQAHIFVLPCLAEKKMPYVAHTKLYEYLALGRPVVAADVPSIREEIHNGSNGVLFRAGDPNALAAALCQVMSAPQAALTIAATGRKFAEKYTWEERALRLEKCFDEVVSQNS